MGLTFTSIECKVVSIEVSVSFVRFNSVNIFVSVGVVFDDVEDVVVVVDWCLFSEDDDICCFDVCFNVCLGVEVF